MANNQGNQITINTAKQAKNYFKPNIQNLTRNLTRTSLQNMTRNMNKTNLQNMTRNMIKSFKILQINLNRCGHAHDLLNIICREEKFDLVLISEPLRIENSWIGSRNGKAAIWNTGFNGIYPNDEDCVYGEDFVGVKVLDTVFISVYKPPNCTREQYICFLEDLVKTRKDHREQMLLAGDFNAKSAAWGSDVDDYRGDLLLETVSEMNLLPVVTKGGNTFERYLRNIVAVSKIDIMSCDKKTYNRIKVSRVLNTDSGSDQNMYCIFLSMIRKKIFRNKSLISLNHGTRIHSTKRFLKKAWKLFSITRPSRIQRTQIWAWLKNI